MWREKGNTDKSTQKAKLGRLAVEKGKVSWKMKMFCKRKHIKKANRPRD